MAAITNLYTIAAVKLNTTLIDEITAQNINPGLSSVILGGSGAAYNNFAAVTEIKPELTFTTMAVKRLLALLGGTGLALTAGGIYLQKTTIGGLRAGASSHLKGTIVAGIAIPTSLKASHGGVATIDTRVVLRSADGTTSPLTLASGQSLEASQDGVDQAYTLGTVTINGSALVGVQSVSVDFGIELWVSNGDGLVYPTHVAVTRISPTITINCYDADQFITMGMDGASIASTAVVNFNNLVEGAVAGSSPIIATVNEGLVTYESLGGSHGERATCSVKIQPTYNGSALPIAWTGLT